MTDSTARSTYRVNKDGWWALKEILRLERQFNPDLSRKWGSRGSWSGYRYTGALRGRILWEGNGKLPEPYATELLNAAHNGEVEYVVYSYETPIAYKVNGKWVTPDVKYSVTTSKHQGNVFTAVSQLTPEEN